MSDNMKPVKVVILDKEFLVACPEEDHAALLDSADFLNDKMKEVQRNGRVIGMDRITVMTALNMAHEILQKNSKEKDIDPVIAHRLHVIQDKIDLTLKNTQQIEL